MIVYGVCVGPSDSYEGICRPSLPTDSWVIVRRSQESIFTAYNSILDEASKIEGLDAVVLMHDDVELGPRFENDVRNALQLDAAVIGTVGSVNPSSIFWSSGSARGKAVETTRVFDFGGGIHDVDTVDGMVMVLAPACVRSLRFDERTYHGFHAYDIDYCFEARKAGYRVVVAPLDVRHHCKIGLGDDMNWRRCNLAWQTKWRTVPRHMLILRRVKLWFAERRRTNSRRSLQQLKRA